MKNQPRLTLPLIALLVTGSFYLTCATYGQEHRGMTKAEFGNSEATRNHAKPMEGSNLKKSETALSAKDKSFMKAAAKGGMMEVEMGKMAEQQGKSADVKKIGKRMVADHGKANKELMAIAAKKGVDLSKEKPAMEKMGADFDKEYIAMMVKDHEKDVAAFEAEARDGADPDVKGFASKTLPTLKKHMAMVKDAQSKMK